MVACGSSTSDEDTPSSSQLAALTEHFATVPATPPPSPSNAVADDAAAAILGQKLFFESRYSENGQVACATCHNPDSGFQDDRNNTALGLDFTGRHPPTILNAALLIEEGTDTNWMLWDGRKDSLWSQALGPPEDGKEMGGSRVGIVYMMYDLYKDEYEAIFGALPNLRDDAGEALFPMKGKPGMPEWEGLSSSEKTSFNRAYSNFGKAIAAYERLLIDRGSPFDDWYTETVVDSSGTSTAISAAARRGLMLFMGKAACTECHNGPALSDGSFHNTGVPQEGPHLPTSDDGRASGVDKAIGDEFNCAGDYSDHSDKSKCGVGMAGLERPVGAFKTPSLRNVAITAPYMHTGTLDTLQAVVEFYDDGGADSGFSGDKDEVLKPLNLTDGEQRDLVAFLESLTSTPYPAKLLKKPTLP